MCVWLCEKLGSKTWKRIADLKNRKTLKKKKKNRVEKIRSMCVFIEKTSAQKVCACVCVCVCVFIKENWAQMCVYVCAHMCATWNF